MKKYILPIGIGIIIVVFVIFKLLNTKKEVENRVYKKDFNQVVPVKVETASYQALIDQNTFTGSFSAQKEVPIIPETQGRIVRLNMEEGQYVGAGEVLAQVDDDLLRFQQQGLEANYASALADVKRYKTLAQQDAIAGVQLEKAELQVKVLESQINTLKKQRANTSIRAPFSGKIISKTVENGSVISPATALGQLADYGSLKLLVKVPEAAVLEFRVGQEIGVTTDVHPNKVIKGKVSLIGDKGDATHNYTLQITVPNTKDTPLKAGMIGRIAPVRQVDKPVLCISKNAIVGSMKNPQVFVISSNKAVLKSIQVGGSDNTRIEVVSGLKEGEQVVVSGQINLSDGSSVSLK